MQPPLSLVVLFAAAALQAESATPSARPAAGDAAQVHRFTPSPGWPYGPEGVHGAALPAEEFRARRAAFLEELAKHGPGTVAVAKSAPVARRNGDVDHEYRQDSDFAWLTGYPESEAVAILDPDAAARKTAVYTLYVLPRDPAKETWTGKRFGPDGARKHFLADDAKTVDQVSADLRAAIARAKTLVLVNGFDREFAGTVDYVLRELREAGGGPERVIDGRRWIGERRLIKSPAEIDAMRKAVEVSIEGHLAAMRASRPGMNEGEIEAAAEFAFRALGAPRVGYPSICGAGNNGCVLHYVTNQEFMGKNDLMLMDAGAEVAFYTADVTRTWPVNGRFTPEQRAIYDVVLRAHGAAVAAVKPGARFEEVHDAAALEVTKGLVELGILRGDPAELFEKKAHRKLFMHGTSHWLGLDVHDAGDYQAKKRKLEPGMVLTVEPGVYVADGTADVDPKWWRIGVRIEDDVLVTPNGRENLSERLPRDAAAIEAIVQGTKAQ